MRSREVISVRDGARLGYLGDIEIDTESASLAAIVVYGRARFFGLFGHEADCVIPWSDISLKTGEFSGRRPPFRGRFGPEGRRRAEARDKAQKNGEKGLI